MTKTSITSEFEKVQNFNDELAATKDSFSGKTIDKNKLQKEPESKRYLDKKDGRVKIKFQKLDGTWTHDYSVAKSSINI